MMRLTFMFLVFLANTALADTMNHYMNIVDNIPKMEIKADPQAQAWARSARNILTLTCECIAETLAVSNDNASKAHKPLFCPPPGGKLEAAKLNELIQETYRHLTSERSDAGNMTVSQVALMAVQKAYPCQKTENHSSMQHVSNVLGE